MRAAGPHQVAPALPEHRHFPIATLLGPGHLCGPQRPRPAPSHASVTTALWAAALTGILVRFLMVTRPADHEILTFFNQMSKLFLAEKQGVLPNQTK